MGGRAGRVACLCLVLSLALVPSPAGGMTALAASIHSPGAVEVTSRDAYRFQGWGTSLAWWANVVGGWQSSDQIVDALFGLPDREHPDRLGLNVIRYNIGASPVLWCEVKDKPEGCAGGLSRDGPFPVADLRRVPACGTFGPGKAIPALADAQGARPDIARDRNQMGVLRAALSRQSRGSFVLEAFANSAPWWLTVNGCPQGNPDLFDAYDNLAAADYGAYADYLADVLHAFSERGIRFDTLDPLNEPENPWGQGKDAYIRKLFCTTGCQEGMHFGLEPPRPRTPSLGLLLDDLCGRLRAHAIETRVSVPDGSNPSFTSALLGLTGSPPACVGQINTHMYGPSELTGARQALSTEARALSKRIWMSEFGTGGAASDMTSGLTYSSVIAADMRWLRPAAWVNWQAVEAGGGWGLFEAPTWPREGPVTRTKRFSALEQYARFIRPGYQVLTTLDPLDDAVHERTETMAAIDDLRHPGRIVVVGTNRQVVGRRVVYDLASLGGQQLLTTATVTRYRTTAAADMERLGSTQLRATSLADDQPPGSITTYVIQLDRKDSAPARPSANP
jgi:O-glycosyl hydrolase